MLEQQVDQRQLIPDHIGEYDFMQFKRQPITGQEALPAQVHLLRQELHSGFDNQTHSGQHQEIYRGSQSGHFTTIGARN